MNPGNSKTVVMIVPTTAQSAATNTGIVDTIGFDHLQVDLVEMSASEATAALTHLSLRENDTVPTAFTAMSSIVALTGAAATSTSAGFVLPTPNSAVWNNYRFNIDLKGRKRYIAIRHENSISTRVACNALLLRCQEGRPMPTSSDATATVTTASCRLNIAI